MQSGDGRDFFMTELAEKQMRDVTYWIDRIPQRNRIVLTKKETEQINTQIYYRCLETGDMFDIVEIAKTNQKECQLGICICRADVKNKPAAQTGVCGMEDDENQLTVLSENEPVVIMRESHCKKWYYLYAQDVAGWVQKDCIIVCPAYRPWIKAQTEKKKSFLSCSAQNILILAFEMLGEPYGWGGSHDFRDCSMMVHDIFGCFGLCLPKDTKGLQSLKGMDFYINLASYSLTEKQQILNRLRPGAVLGFPGHVMIYLGKAGEEYYVIGQTGHFYEKTPEGFEKVAVRSCVVNPLSVYRKNQKTWLESLTYILLYDF